MKIEPGRTVTLAYRLFDADGEMVETDDPEEPLTYVHGGDDLFQVLQDVLEGSEVGAEHRIELSCDDSFGDVDPDLLITVPRDEFPADAELVPGDLIAVQISPEEGEDGEDEELEMRIVEVSPDGVVLDGNHPLAGQDVTFELKVLSIE